jgi:hypothetical protein
MNVTEQLKELAFDIRDKQDKKSILAVFTLVTAIAFTLMKSTQFTIVNLVFLMNPILTGWMINIGWESKKQGKVAILILVSVAFGFELCIFWNFAEIMTKFSQMGEMLKNLKNTSMPNFP